MGDAVYARAVVDGSASPRDLRLAIDLPEGAPYSFDDIVKFRIASSATLMESAESLFQLLSGPYSVWVDGTLLETRALVERLHGLKMEIYSREHGPAHFHVVAPGINASFAIADCRLLEGEISGRHRRMVEYWHASARAKLIEVWNSTRPTDCPVGPMNDT